MTKYPMYIDGQAVWPQEYFDVVNPATDEPFAQCAKGSVDDVEAAVSSARKAFAHWSTVPAEERKALLHQVAGLIEENTPELMSLITQETGKPMAGLNGVGAGMELGGTAAWARVNADLDLPTEIIQDNDDARIEVHHKPLGVVASITPWNWPLMIAIWHIVPALRAGNTVVLKASELTPVATARFVELANSVLPAGVLNLVSGGGEIGARLSEHNDIAKVVFTGSTPTGKHIMRSAAGNLKRLTLELGGNDAAIVLDDINVKEVAPQLIGACFHNNGQTCACLKRLYVHESIYEELCAEMASLAGKLIVGDGSNPETELGPVQNRKQLQIVQAFADSAREDGGRFLCGGQPIDGPGYFFEPTLVADLRDGSKLVDEEPFGPITPIIKYSDLDEVIERANSNPSGLGGSVWSADPQRASAVAQKLECGSAWVNEHGAIQPDVPFGGVKQSGFGVEFGVRGLEEFTSIQVLKVPKS